MKYYIYRIYNNFNDMCYIGQHHMLEKEYPRQYMGSGSLIESAYKQYGRQNFFKEILEYVEDDKKRLLVSEREKYWIEYYNSEFPNGYNLNKGGFGGCDKNAAKKVVETKRRHGYKITEETKRKISESNKGKTLSETHKKHLSENHHLLKEWRIEHEEDGSIEVYNGSLTKYCKEHNTNPNTLKRKSAKGEFVNGIRLVDIDLSKYACLKSYNYKDKKFYDPILKEICSYCTLRTRKSRSKELYKDVIPKEYMITE